MNCELMMQEDVRVLPYDLRNVRQSDWWRVQAVIRVLTEMSDAVIIGAGQGGLIETVSDPCSGMQVIATELSVMGLTRAKLHRSKLDLWGCEAPHIVSMESRGAPRRRGYVGTDETQDYLTATVLGPTKSGINLYGDVLEGLDIRPMTKGSRKAVSSSAGLVEQVIRLISGASCKDR